MILILVMFVLLVFVMFVIILLLDKLSLLSVTDGILDACQRIQLLALLPAALRETAL